MRLRIPQNDKHENPLADFEGEVSKNYRWNFTINVINYGLFLASLSFVSITTVLPAFLNHFTASNTIIATIFASRTLGYFLPQILVAHYLERLERKKRLVLAVSTGERIPWLLLIFLTPFMTQFPAGASIAIFILLFSVINFSGGVVLPAWLDMFGKIIPERKRGKFMGMSNFLGGALGIAAAWISIYILRNYPFPNNFSLLFLSCFIVSVFSWIALSLNREPVYPFKKERVGIKRFFANLPVIIRKDKNFRSYLIASILLSFSNMSGPFFILAAIRRLGATDDQVGGFTLLLVVSQTFTNLLWGYLGDKKGYKLLTALGGLVQVAAALIAVWADSLDLFYIIFALIGAGLSLEMMVALNIVLEFGSLEERPTYIGIANTVRSPFMGLSPILGGVIADRFSLGALFITTAILVSLGLLWLSFLVVEPRKNNSYKKQMT